MARDTMPTTAEQPIETHDEIRAKAHGDDLWSRYAAIPSPTDLVPDPRARLAIELAVTEQVFREYVDEAPFVARLLKLIELVREVMTRQDLYIDLAKSIILEEEKRRGCVPKPPPP